MQKSMDLKMETVLGKDRYGFRNYRGIREDILPLKIKLEEQPRERNKTYFVLVNSLKHSIILNITDCLIFGKRQGYHTVVVKQYTTYIAMIGVNGYEEDAKVGGQIR